MPGCVSGIPKQIAFQSRSYRRVNDHLAESHPFGLGQRSPVTAGLDRVRITVTALIVTSVIQILEQSPLAGAGFLLISSLDALFPEDPVEVQAQHRYVAMEAHQEGY